MGLMSFPYCGPTATGLGWILDFFAPMLLESLRGRTLPNWGRGCEGDMFRCEGGEPCLFLLLQDLAKSKTVPRSDKESEPFSCLPSVSAAAAAMAVEERACSSHFSDFVSD